MYITQFSKGIDILVWSLSIVNGKLKAEKGKTALKSKLFFPTHSSQDQISHYQIKTHWSCYPGSEQLSS